MSRFVNADDLLCIIRKKSESGKVWTVEDVSNLLDMVEEHGCCRDCYFGEEIAPSAISCTRGRLYKNNVGYGCGFCDDWEEKENDE